MVRIAPTPHVPFIYRFTAKALGAGMWFFVCANTPFHGYMQLILEQIFYRAKKDGGTLLTKVDFFPWAYANQCVGPVMLGWRHPWDHH